MTNGFGVYVASLLSHEANIKNVKIKTKYQKSRRESIVEMLYKNAHEYLKLQPISKVKYVMLFRNAGSKYRTLYTM